MTKDKKNLSKEVIIEQKNLNKDVTRENRNAIRDKKNVIRENKNVIRDKKNVIREKKNARNRQSCRLKEILWAILKKCSIRMINKKRMTDLQEKEMKNLIAKNNPKKTNVNLSKKN